MYNSKNKNLFLQQEKFLILKTVKLTIKKYNDTAEDSQGSMAQHFCGNVMVYQKAFGTVWSTSPGPRLPTTDATNSSLPLLLYINMTHGFPNKHPISIAVKARKTERLSPFSFLSKHLPSSVQTFWKPDSIHQPHPSKLCLAVDHRGHFLISKMPKVQ